MTSGGQQWSDSDRYSLHIPEDAQRADLIVFVERVLRLDEAAVIRLRVRADGLIGAWAATGFDVLVGRVVSGDLVTPDLTCGADELRRGLVAADAFAGSNREICLISLFCTVVLPCSSYRWYSNRPRSSNPPAA